jgi:hypothetical protein
MVCKKRAFYETESSSSSTTTEKIFYSTSATSTSNKEKIFYSTSTTSTSNKEKTFNSAETSSSNTEKIFYSTSSVTSTNNEKTAKTPSKLPTLPSSKIEKNSNLNFKKIKKSKKNRSLCLDILENESKSKDDTSEAEVGSKRSKRNVSLPVDFPNGLPSSSAKPKDSSSPTGSTKKQHSPSGSALE